MTNSILEGEVKESRRHSQPCGEKGNKADQKDLTASELYGYGEDSDSKHNAEANDLHGHGNAAAARNDLDYGYEESAVPAEEPLPPERQVTRHRSRRRNSCLVRRDQDPLAVAEYLMGGPPRMSDNDLALENTEIVT